MRTLKDDVLQLTEVNLLKIKLVANLFHTGLTRQKVFYFQMQLKKIF